MSASGVTEACQPGVSVSVHTACGTPGGRPEKRGHNCISLEGRGESTSMLGEGHRDRKVQNLTATSPSGLQRLCDRGTTGTAYSSELKYMLSCVSCSGKE